MSINHGDLDASNDVPYNNFSGSDIDSFDEPPMFAPDQPDQNAAPQVQINLSAMVDELMKQVEDLEADHESYQLIANSLIEIRDALMEIDLAEHLPEMVVYMHNFHVICDALDKFRQNIELMTDHLLERAREINDYLVIEQEIEAKTVVLELLCDSFFEVADFNNLHEFEHLVNNFTVNSQEFEDAALAIVSDSNSQE